MQIKSIIKKGVSYFRDSAKRSSSFGISLSIIQIAAKFSPFIPMIPKFLQKKLQVRIEKRIKEKLVNEIDFDTLYSRAINKDIDSQHNRPPKKIWMMWLQGEDSAPELVQNCIKRARKVSKQNNYEFVLITSSNMNDFCQVPNYILRKYQDGAISNAHFADYYRCLLLSTQGGMWLDATVYIAAGNLNEIFDYTFYSIKRQDDFRSVAHQRWTTSCLYQTSDALPLAIVAMALGEYWKRYNMSIDYLLIDYIIAIVYEKYAAVKTLMDEVPYNNYYYDIFESYLNESYEESRYTEILLDTDLFKLSYKNNIKENPNSYYNVVINQTI